jgi:hypothetical protein
LFLVLLTEEKGAFFLCRNHFMGVHFVEAALDEQHLNWVIWVGFKSL